MAQITIADATPRVQYTVGDRPPQDRLRYRGRTFLIVILKFIRMVR